MKKKLASLPLLMALSFLTVPFTMGAIGEVERSFPSPGPSPTGMAWDGKHLWIADMKVHRIFKVRPEDGTVISSIPSPGLWPAGLAWDGSHLWNADTVEKKIFVIDPATGKVLRTMDSPTDAPRGMAFDRNDLWLLDDASDEISRVSTSDGTTIASLKAPGQEATGVSVDGDYFWLSDRMTDEIYRIHKRTGDVLFVLSAPGPYAWGLAWDGKNLFNVDYQNDRVYVLKIDDPSRYLLREERKAIVESTHRVINYGPGKITNMNAYIAIPETRDSQTVEGEIIFDPKPDEILTDRWGQKIAHYRYKDLPAPSIKEAKMKIRAKVYSITYFIFPEKVGSLDDIPREIKEKYLVDDEKYMINDPIIRKAASDAVVDEKNPYWIARKIYNYCIEHLQYERTGGWNVAPAVLKRGNGSCSEYTFVYIAMCRAAGLPARYVGSVVVRGDDASMDDVFHRWVEVYLPNYGWVPVDPSGGDSPSPRERAKYFGSLRNRFLITTTSGGGSEYLSWTYNFNEFYQTEPQTKVQIESFAEWDSLKDR
ncbi:MAG: transglutaminase domain-containing protein [Acidobacteriota bacterium]